MMIYKIIIIKIKIMVREKSKKLQESTKESWN